MLSTWSREAIPGLKSILWEILFLEKLHDFTLLSSNSFLHPFFKSKFMKNFLAAEKNSFLKIDLHESSYRIHKQLH